MMLWAILAVAMVLAFSVFYSCSAGMEGFEGTSMKKVEKGSGESEEGAGEAGKETDGAEEAGEAGAELAEQLKRTMGESVPMDAGEEAVVTAGDAKKPKKSLLPKKNSADVSKIVEKTQKADEANKPIESFLNEEEQELFEQITKNLISGKELEKLIKAGVLTENMIEKFLNQIDLTNNVDGVEPEIEGFCAGTSCMAPF